ncbi:(2Fe-2S)-binding protein [Pseudoduganella danionis]|uniref:(2Fe-2S)-binding protein n=1 Tax=Pseudoduganella danionis TaxID=1890295 RepID=UPI0012D4AFB7|nr:(2Fe-2S)-binding protein [Pseudoduganella danionis]
MADITIYLNDQAVRVEAGISVAAALAIHGSAVTRYSVTGTARAPLCGMGVCQECRTTINGMQHQLACQTPCVEGMRVERCEVAQ